MERSGQLNIFHYIFVLNYVAEQSFYFPIRLAQVMEQRHVETQAVLLDESRAASEQGSVTNQAEPKRRSAVIQQEAAAFSLNLSFEELSGAGLEEPPRPNSNSQWTVSSHLCSSV